MEKTINKKKTWKIVGFVALGVVIAMLLTVVGYVIYVFADYHRIEDNVELEVNGEAEIKSGLKMGDELKIVSYNTGFAAYTPDYSFFMDGGKYSRAFSKESVYKTMEGIVNVLSKQEADFMIIEEVDKDATRSYHIDQSEIIANGFKGFNSVFAVNYDSPYLFYPITSPHGKSYAGIMTMSRYKIESGLRRSFPIETSVYKLIDLDRCYSTSRIKAENGKELVIFSAHLSAYTSDGKIAIEQLSMLCEDMKKEYEKGNYVVCGGDFNMDLLGDSSKYFGVSDSGDQTWAKPIPKNIIDGCGLKLVAPIDENNPVPSCRNADAPYHEGQLVLTVDGFIVSENIDVLGREVVDTGFAYSDHNPVSMRFRLK